MHNNVREKLRIVMLIFYLTVPLYITSKNNYMVVPLNNPSLL